MFAKNSRGRSMLDMVLGEPDRQTEPEPSTSTEFNSNQKDESFSLLCDETFPSSLMDISLTDITFETEKPSEIIPIASSSMILTSEEPQNNNLNHDTHTTESSHVVNIESENNIEQVTTQEKTKSGNPRKRRKFEESLETRLKYKKKGKLDKMAVKPGCNETCIKKCMSSFTELERIRINDTFWKFDYEAQGLYVKSLVIEKEVQRRIKDSQMMRKHTYMYFFDTDNKKKEVCKTFFLTTLGYHKNNDRRVLDILKKLPEAQGDRRGKHDNSKKFDRETIKQHIESFKPAIAHYRRAHAPNRRYLPSDLNATMMHADFIEKNPNFKVSYDLYRKFLKKDMNISFAQLGNEECEQCEIFKLHQNSCKDTEHCTDCATYQIHREKYEKARTYYQQDVTQSVKQSESSKCYYSADLQKVIMLPRLDMFKVVMFCPRIIAFNESFVPLGSSKEKPFAAVWHEAISGRKQEDIISTYRLRGNSYLDRQLHQSK
ncbi:unnamed protein product [Euphydryas editha]|uniref:Uncharacterized protein n=1 Tax=Euphydryas editha TaxID=104508 RepID=A0AAU9TSY7_EUPED|nr:unnamed protein product [Euphydryas editha]